MSSATNSAGCSGRLEGSGPVSVGLLDVGQHFPRIAREALHPPFSVADRLQLGGDPTLGFQLDYQQLQPMPHLCRHRERPRRHAALRMVNVEPPGHWRDYRRILVESD